MYEKKVKRAKGRSRIAFLCAAMLAVSAMLTGCRNSGSPESNAAAEEETAEKADAEQKEESKPAKEEKEVEIAIPEYTTVEYTENFMDELENVDLKALEEPCDEQGTLVTLKYETPAYAINEIKGLDITLEKELTVYLPYEYDETQRYNVLYLLHGTGGDEKYWLVNEKTGTPTKNVLDNMIQQGLCDPVIVVTPDYYSDDKDADFTDDDVVAYAESVSDPLLKVKNDVWPEFFGYELRNNIIPCVEGEYSTYAGGNTDEESLIASRDHRALAGLSRGSMATARSGFMKNTDILAYIGSFSDIWADFDQFKEVLTEGAFKDYEIKYWYNGNGNKDSISIENHITFHNQVMEQMNGKFVDGQNYALVVKDGCEHQYEGWIIDLYNSLLMFFQ